MVLKKEKIEKRLKKSFFCCLVNYCGCSIDCTDCGDGNIRQIFLCAEQLWICSGRYWSGNV